MSAQQQLTSAVDDAWQRWRDGADEAARILLDDTAFVAELKRVWEGSDYVVQACLRYPELLIGLHSSGNLHRAFAEGEMDARLRASLSEVADANALARQLRLFRREQMVRIIWRDLARLAPLAETLEDLSALADASVRQALAFSDHWLRAEMGVPRDARGEPQQMVILGMGKLGARELNLSSDIDLIFTYPANGQVDGPRARSNEEYFTRLAQQVIKALNSPTVDGFVFRVDARLRPFGEAGPLALSFTAMEAYYESQAREWERYAMVKARVVAGDHESGERLIAMLRPFVYRRYLDFGAIESLREMKRLISQELHRRGMDHNIKLGKGGIREVEFIGQAFQLIRGGREPDLQIRPILKVLTLLERKKHLPPYVVQELTEAYEFLRLVENRLQAWVDKQTHVLPADELGRLRLARSMGFEDWQTFAVALEHRRLRVQGHFDKVFAAPQTDDEEDGHQLTLLWQGSLEEMDALTALREAGFEDPQSALIWLVSLRGSAPCRALGTRGREQLDRLMPLLLQAVGGVDNAQQTLERIGRLIEAIARRTAYLSLLLETPLALSQLVRLSSVSELIPERLTRMPLLLDELLDPRRLYEPLRRTELAAELDTLLGAVEADDLEQQMDRLRQFVQSNQLRVAAADITGAIPLMVVSDYLTDIAEVTMARVMEMAWSALVAKNGKPSQIHPDAGEGNGFIVIAYGKLGGIELGYGSDLDLVFLHADYPGSACTLGEKSIGNDVFYARMAQRLIHLSTTRTPAGILYELDMRLRPNGASGMLVSAMESFRLYQETSAWTWEHQALIRARAVAGDPGVRARFEQIRRDILTRPRDADTLRGEVRDMRERMRAQLDKSSAELFDLKQGPGGIADIEFMVQYLVLRWAHQHPDLTQWTDNIRLLETLARLQLLDGGTAAALADAYRALRAANHRQSLQGASGPSALGALENHRRLVQDTWKSLMEGDAPA